jgi:hypothetical protein
MSFYMHSARAIECDIDDNVLVETHSRTARLAAKVINTEISPPAKWA